MPDIIATSLQPHYGALVTLYVLDATAHGGDVFRFTTGSFGADAVVFSGEPYSPVPCEVTGLSWNGDGAIPTPQFQVSNIAGQFVTAVLGTDSLLGARLTIIKTFDQFLDNGESPDPNSHFPHEEFYVDQLSKMDNETVVWKLAALFDLRGVKLPRRQVLRDACTNRYRRYVNNGFDYSNVTCPYTGDQSFNLQNESVGATQDKCALNLAACRLRFGTSATLPFSGFPGAARIRERV